MLTKELRDVKNEYFREWRKKNPDKIQAINTKFWEKKRQEKIREEEGNAINNY